MKLKALCLYCFLPFVSAMMLHYENCFHNEASLPKQMKTLHLVHKIKDTAADRMYESEKSKDGLQKQENIMIYKTVSN